MKTLLLQKTEIKEVFPKEVDNLSPFISENDTIKHILTLLGYSNIDKIESIQPTLEDATTNFRCDITLSIQLTKDESSKINIIIENQLNNSDHDHLGKLLTYYSYYKDIEGKKPNIAIWIAPYFKEEHLKAINLLNQIDEEINFVAIKLLTFKDGYVSLEIASDYKATDVKKDITDRIKCLEYFQFIKEENFKRFKKQGSTPTIQHTYYDFLRKTSNGFLSYFVVIKLRTKTIEVGYYTKNLEFHEKCLALDLETKFPQDKIQKTDRRICIVKNQKLLDFNKDLDVNDPALTKWIFETFKQFHEETIKYYEN